MVNPNRRNSRRILKAAKKRTTKLKRMMERISVAPGESGKFVNWSEDPFLEERCFVELFPFGVGAYISSTFDQPNSDLGFAKYCRNQLLSCDPKFRNNEVYVFFLLIVKELIALKRCQSTFLRQATMTPNLTKESLMSVNPEDLNRFNRTFQVYKPIRGA